MKRITRYSELQSIKEDIPREIGEFLDREFQGLYEYLNKGEEVEQFLLLPYQAMIILEEERELKKLLSNPIEIEYVEEVLESTLLRIGVRNGDEIQLCYYLDTYKV